MSEKETMENMPTVLIPRKHQSAPKEHWADKEIKKAAEEIDAGRYIPDAPSDASTMNGLGLALGLGNRGVAVGEKPRLSEFQQTRDFEMLGQHPRVMEAMERLQREKEEARDPQEAVEKSWMLHEMAEKQAAIQKWDGQERWEGKENEEMRIGRILAPQQFYDQLCKVIGRERILLSHHAVKTSPDARSARVGLYVRNPEWRGEAPKLEYPHARAAQLRAQGEQMLVKAKRYRATGLHTKADQTFNMAAECAKAATEILMELERSTFEERAHEFLRVGTLQWPCGTEWMMMNFNEYGVPTTAKYLGWRTALLTMVRSQCLTEQEANKAFPLGTSRAAEWYQQQMYMLRNRGWMVN